MKDAVLRCAFLVTLGLVVVPASADDLTGSDRFLCTAVQVNACYLDGDDCLDSIPPWILDVPQFIEVDLNAKKLSTTKASGENRSTAIEYMERENGRIFLLGVEEGRAFSFVITESTGRVTVAVARDDANVGVFGACTPMPVQ
ncbi:MAG: hypothetical protein PVF68_06235 [Acidobacteriota bacterium]